MVLNPKAWWTYLRSSGANFHTVVPGRIFRGATPSPEDLETWYLKYGIRTWIDLRQADDWDGNDRTMTDKHRHFIDQLATCERIGIKRIWIPISDRTPTPDASIEKVLAHLRDRTQDGIFIACAGGRHRAGEMVALYGQRELGWSEAEVKKSLKQGGFYASGHRAFAKRLEQLLGFTLALLLAIVPAFGQHVTVPVQTSDLVYEPCKDNRTREQKIKDGCLVEMGNGLSYVCAVGHFCLPIGSHDLRYFFGTQDTARPKMSEPIFAQHPFIQPDRQAPKQLAPVDLEVLNERFGRSFWVASGIYASAVASDFYTTDKAIERGGREGNPLFAVDDGRRVRYVANALASAGIWGVAAYAERRGHGRAARVLLYVAAAIRFTAAIWNHSRRR